VTLGDVGRHQEPPNPPCIGDTEPPRSDRRLWVVLAILATFMSFEVATGALYGSLAVLSDAAHMLTDVASVGGALWAASLSRRPPRLGFTYGLSRAETVAAAANGVGLLVAAALILESALRHLAVPPPVNGRAMVAVALAGIVVSAISTAILSRQERRSLNVEGVLKHIAADLAAYLGTAAAGALVWTTGFRRADPIMAMVVVAIMVYTAWGLLAASGRILLEGTPIEVEVEEVRRHLLAMEGVVSVHDLHAWTLSSELPVLTAHVVVSDDYLSNGSAGRLLDDLQACLVGHFDVEHSTFQLEPAGHDEHEAGLHD
jgi:cobalt-zinc-cadmium efflux system protein